MSSINSILFMFHSKGPGGVSGIARGVLAGGLLWIDSYRSRCGSSGRSLVDHIQCPWAGRNIGSHCRDGWIARPSPRSGWQELFLRPVASCECDFVGTRKILPVHGQMRVVVCYAAEPVHPASARIDFPAGHNERSVTDAALEGVVPPSARAAGWHDQAGPVDTPVVPRFL